MSAEKKQGNARSDMYDYNPEQFYELFNSITNKSQDLLHSYINGKMGFLKSSDLALFNDAAQSFSHALTNIVSDPQKLIDAQMSFYQSYMALFANAAARMMGEEVTPVFEATHKDRRFRDELWKENYVFDFIKQSYLLTSKWLHNTIDASEDGDAELAKKLDFYTNQYLDAISPSNFIMTNPEVLKETLQTNGQNLVNGFKNLLEDFKEGGSLDISMTDKSAYVVGKDLAITPGHVVFENELLQLIMYSPTTAKVHKNPVLIISPWINKYYILDMRPDNSFVKWMVDQGYTVFITSWANADESLSHITFEDYLAKGSLAAIDAVKKATQSKEINIIGYCIGGTLTAITLAYLAKHKKLDSITSATLLTTEVDFSDPGELGLLISDSSITSIEKSGEEKGYFNGKSMGNIFRMLRANDLVWSFVINNYLLGKEPLPFDLLFWNSDCTNLPIKMHSYYLRNMYRENNLIEKDKLTFLNTPIDVSLVTTPTYLLSTTEDHIAPWKGTYKTTELFSGPKKFVLSGSGHIAGVVNPPAKRKYGYRCEEKSSSRYPKNPEKWLEKTTAHEGSWWKDWDKWMKDNHYTGGEIDARSADTICLEPIEKAPGRYVLKSC